MIAVWIATVLSALVVVLAVGWLWTWLQWRECLRLFNEYHAKQEQLWKFKEK